MGMALRSKSDHGNFFVFDIVQIRVFIVINLHISSCCVSGLAISIAGTVSFARVVELAAARFCSSRLQAGIYDFKHMLA
jgi:hypothetical protein